MQSQLLNWSQLIIVWPIAIWVMKHLACLIQCKLYPLQVRASSLGIFLQLMLYFPSHTVVKWSILSLQNSVFVKWLHMSCYNNIVGYISKVGFIRDHAVVKYCLRMEDFRGEQRRSVVTKLIANEMGGGSWGGHKNITVPYRGIR